MTDSKILSALIELATRDLNEAAGQLSRQAEHDRHARTQLERLRGYRADYTTRLARARQMGMTASNYANFTLFIATLDNAIMQQNRVLSEQKSNMAACRRQWRGRHGRLKALEALAARLAQARVLRRNKAEQRADEELSSIQHSRRARYPH
jgi:flagellar FliJ protein